MEAAQALSKSTLKVIGRRIKSHSKASQQPLPWILVGGMPCTGKSSLIHEAKTDTTTLYPTSDETAHTTADTLQDNTWYGTEHAIWVEYGTLNNLRSLCQSPNGKRMQALVVVIDVYHLCQKVDDCVTHITSILREIKALRHPLNVTLIINKLDYLHGFYEYFDDFTQDERAQPLGFSLPAYTANHILKRDFNKQFYELLGKVSHRLFTRLHQERSLIKRTMLKNFPVQFERLKTNLEKLVTHLPWQKDLSLTGVYFSSCKQPQTADTDHKEVIFESDERSITIRQQARTERTFFVDDIFHSLEYVCYRHMGNAYSPRKRLAWLLGGLAVLATAVLLWQYSYQSNTAQLNQIQYSLKALSAKTVKQKDRWLSKLNVLSQVASTQSDAPTALSKWIGLNEANALVAKADKRYTQQLKSSLLPYAQIVLTNALREGIKSKKPGLYSTLKVYLMLSQPKRSEPTAIKAWFHRYFVEQFAGQTLKIAQLDTHIDNLLRQSLFHSVTDPLLIKEARQHLMREPKAKLALTLLLQKEQDQSKPLLSADHTIAGINTDNIHIAAPYQIEHFATIYNKRIPHATQQLRLKDWVLNAMPASDAILSDKTLTMQMQTMFLRDYAAHWQKALNSITLSPNLSLNDLHTLAKQLSNTHSPFWQLIHILIQNASVTVDASRIPPHVQQIQSWLRDARAMKQFNQRMVSMMATLGRILRDKDVNAISYNTAVKRLVVDEDKGALTQLERITPDLPAIVQNWLQDYTRNVWQQILQHTANHIQARWEQQVWPVYQQHIRQRYPIFTDAAQDISLKDFGHFFGKHGVMDVFFQTYLKPFVDTSKSYWVWRVDHGQHLPFQQSQLEMFQRANLLQKMFFQDNTGPQFNFTLKPENTSSDIVNFVLNMDGQATDASRVDAVHIRWPGDTPGVARLDIMNTHDHTATFAKRGPWALFRLLQQSDVTLLSDVKNYRITFKSGTDEISFVLETDRVINPLIPNIMKAFRLEKTLQ